jgi:hypothetical protein
VTELRQDVTELRQDVTELRQDVTELRQDVTELRQDVTELHQGQEELKTGFATLGRSQERLERSQQRTEDRLLVLGNRWGPQNEAAVRSALRGLLAGLGYVVESYSSFDGTGEVHGIPAPVEIDVVVRDSELWLVEIKGRVSGNDLYAFIRKARFYQAQTGRQPTRRIIVAPVVEEPAQARATQEGIECYSAADTLKIE